MFNHRSVAEHPADDPHARRHDRLRGEGATRWPASSKHGLDDVRAAAAARFRARPRVYFEEWDEPQISGIRWVSELIGIAGGDDCFPELAQQVAGPRPHHRRPAGSPRRAPDLILGSWCGKKFSPRAVAARPGWDDVPAVRDGELHEIKSSIILQPGRPR